MLKYLIIGNSAGGIGAAEAIREIDGKGKLTIISDEPYPAYSRPRISEYLAGESAEEQMWYRPRDFYERNRVDLLLGKKVGRLHLKQQQAELEDGERISWDRLLLAQGGAPIVPPMDGVDRKNVFTFTTLDDAKGIGAALDGASRAVVIGGGLIGMSVTEALSHRGLEVVVVELIDRVLGALVDEQASRMVEEKLRQRGVRLITGQTVQKIVGRPGDDGTVGGVILQDGESIPCSLLVVAIGVSPRKGLAADAGLEVNRGILVDGNMAASFPGVYACGDVAEAYDFIQEGRRVTPLWPNAYVGGRVAGRNMAGVATQYLGATNVNSLKYFGLPVACAGLSVAPDGAVGPDGADGGHEVLSSMTGSDYRKVILRDGRLEGMILVGDISTSGIIFGLMRDRVDVSELKEALLNPEFGLANLPRELREKVLASAGAPG
ncbi:MAG: FAD-dependent oxidoreductase [Dehalococcoidia bacterium]